MSKSKMKRQPNDFNITIEGDIQALDVNVLTSTLQNFNTLVQEIGRETNLEHQVAVKVKPFKPGSFDIFFAIAADPSVTNSLFSAIGQVNSLGAANIISTLADVLSIKEFIGSKKPKSVKKKTEDSMIIKNNSGKTKVVSNVVHDILNNSTVNFTINNTFQILQQDPNIDGLALKDNEGKKKYKTKRNGFKNLAGVNPLLDKKGKVHNTISKSKAPLSIFKLVFGEKNNWEFYLEGNKISATLNDEKFIKKMLKGQVEFKNGDVMIADVEVLQVFNDIANVFENKKYSIKKVHEIKHMASQAEIEFQ